jgi:hypothetical protein
MVARWEPGPIFGSPALERWEDGEVETSWGYIARPRLKKQNKTKKQPNKEKTKQKEAGATNEVDILAIQAKELERPRRWWWDNLNTEFGHLCYRKAVNNYTMLRSSLCFYKQKEASWHQESMFEGMSSWAWSIFMLVAHNFRNRSSHHDLWA